MWPKSLYVLNHKAIFCAMKQYCSSSLCEGGVARSGERGLSVGLHWMSRESLGCPWSILLWVPFGPVFTLFLQFKGIQGDCSFQPSRPGDQPPGTLHTELSPSGRDQNPVVCRGEAARALLTNQALRVAGRAIIRPDLSVAARTRLEWFLALLPQVLVN